MLVGICNLIFRHFFCHIAAKSRARPVLTGIGNQSIRRKPTPTPQVTGNFLTFEPG